MNKSQWIGSIEPYGPPFRKKLLAADNGLLCEYSRLWAAVSVGHRVYITHYLASPAGRNHYSIFIRIHWNGKNNERFWTDFEMTKKKNVPIWCLHQKLLMNSKTVHGRTFVEFFFFLMSDIIRKVKIDNMIPSFENIRRGSISLRAIQLVFLCLVSVTNVNSSIECEPLLVHRAQTQIVSEQHKCKDLLWIMVFVFNVCEYLSLSFSPSVNNAAISRNSFFLSWEISASSYYLFIVLYR